MLQNLFLMSQHNKPYQKKMGNSYDNPYEEAVSKANDQSKREQFWKQHAENVSWFKFPSKILDASRLEFARWYPDGQINITHNMIDRYLDKHSQKTALIWVSNMVNQQKTFTLRQVYENVCKMCIVLKNNGVKKGDRIIIYMPMIPEALFAVWACARIGAVHSIVFGGFAAKQLSGRILDAKPKLIIAASCGLQPNKKVNYVDILVQAIQISKHQQKVLIYQRPNLQIKCPEDWINLDLSKVYFKDVPCQKMLSTDYLYILYTSGTTGTPKGIVRDHGGTTVALEYTMKHIMGINLGDTYFASSDIGWVVGHSFTVYGPLIRGAATVLYEGKPMLPNPGVLWAIIQKYKVNGLYTSPTGLRAIRREDNQGQWVKKYNLSTLHNVSMAGQRCDIPTYEWIRSKLNILINDNYWQTECGWIISCNYKNLHTFEPKAGSATKPAPGFNVQIMSHQNQKLPLGQLGKVCIKLPMPPSFMLTLYNNDQVFLDKYMKQTPGYYTTGDAGFFDKDGYLNVMTRLDDIINTAGHRLSTAQMQEVLMGHSAISQAAVVAKIQQLKGQIPIGFVVIKKDHKVQNIQKQLIALIRHQIGPVAGFQHVIVVQKLPKTRSGKILRNILRKIIEGEEYKFPATIEDESALKGIQQKVKLYGKGLGQKKKLIYTGDDKAKDKFDQWYYLQDAGKTTQKKVKANEQVVEPTQKKEQQKQVQK